MICPGQLWPKNDRPSHFPATRAFSSRALQLGRADLWILTDKEGNERRKKLGDPAALNAADCK